MPFMLRCCAWAAVSFAIVGWPANASIVAKCGPSKGHAYYFSAPLLPKNGTGWQQDGISKGAILLMRDGAEYDVVITDTAGTRSLKADGFQIVDLGHRAPFLVLLAIHPNTRVVEHYMFQLQEDGSGTVVWGVLKGSGVGFPKSSIYESTCNGPS